MLTKSWNMMSTVSPKHAGSCHRNRGQHAALATRLLHWPGITFGVGNFQTADIITGLKN